MIEVTGISKSFNEKQVLQDISIKFLEGKTNMIIGESGSGKTVLTKIMVGLFPPDSGDVLYDGKSFTAMNFDGKKEVRKQIGMLFQGGALFDSLTVEENIIFPLSMFTTQTEAEKRDRAQFCLERVNLPTAGKLYPSELSGGMKKRVGIARAISMNPRYLFCDEPNSGLDPRTSILIDNLIRQITEELRITTIVITHDMNSVIEIGENVVFIFNGQKWWQGNKSEILHSENAELNRFVYASTFMQRVRNSLKLA